MFESLVANLVNRFLGSYIENFDPKQLNIGIWNGDVKLTSLRLKKDSLDRFKLPIDIKFGHIGELTLLIPWSNLKGQPVKVVIDDVYLLASPVMVNEFDLDLERQKELNIKRDKLRHLTAIEQTQLQIQVSTDDKANESFTESLITKIIDNLQVTIKNIHIRYEDDGILTETPYSVGITLKELSAVSTDESWIPSFISITQTLTRKVLTLLDLAVYMNTQSISLYNDDPGKMLETFRAHDDDQYILRPVSGNGKLSLNKLGSTPHIPHIKAELLFQEFGIDLDSQQYTDMLWTLSKFHWYIKTYKFRKFRPKVSVAENPKLWFQYAATSILNEIHERNYKWSWKYFETRRNQRLEYIKLYKHHFLTKALALELLELEDQLSFEDIKFYRSLARNQLRKEKNLNPSHKAQEPQPGWFGGWFKANDKLEQLQLQLSDDQRKALYETIDYNENEIIDAIDLPEDTVTLEVLVGLSKGGFSIRPHRHSAHLAEIVFEGCQTQIYQRPNSWTTNFQIDEFRIEDGTEKTLYKHIVSVKQYDTDTDQAKDPFFRVSFEHHPLDGSADSKLLAKLKSMTIFYNPTFIDEVARFFKPPKVHLDTIGAIMNAAEATMEGITTLTRIGLQYALEEHKTINIKLDLQAPLIILPLDPHDWKSPVAIVDAGHISVVSQLVDKAKIEEMKLKIHYDDDDWHQLKTLMYDTFTLTLQDAQFLVGANIRDTMLELHFVDHQQRKSSILDKLNLKLLLGISILPEVYNLSRFKISGEVPRILLLMNDFQYKTILSIIDNAVPDFTDDDDDNDQVFAAYGHRELVIDYDYDTSAGETAANQNMVEFNLNVAVVHLALSRYQASNTEPFVELVGDNLDLKFSKTVNDMFLKFELADIRLIDHIEPSGIGEFQHLVSSNVMGSSKAVLKLDYSRKQRLVEFNHKEIPVFDQDITMDIATVKLVISRNSILSILDFVLTTFTDPNAEATPADELNHNDNNKETGPQKINLDINLDSVILVLNEDGTKLATLQLSTATIKMLILPEAMDIRGHLGALTLNDDININHTVPELRKLISMEGDNLLEFTYQTFDPETNKHCYDSELVFQFGSSKVMFVESSLLRIINYLDQFQQMKEMYDQARLAALELANQIDYSSKLKFNISVKAPRIVFPQTIDSTNYNQLIVELGELYAVNEFVDNHNTIVTGLRNVEMRSVLKFGDIVQVSDMVKGFDLSFDVDYGDVINVTGRMPEVDLNVTELQVQYLMRISQALNKFTQPHQLDEKQQHQPPPATATATATVATEVGLMFGIPKLSLTLYNGTYGVESLHECKLTTFSLNGFKLTFNQHHTSFDSNLQVESFVVEDVRPHSDSCFKQIIPLVDNNQFIMNASSQGDNTTIMINVNNPQIILSLDYLFELEHFLTAISGPQVSTVVAKDNSITSHMGVSINIDKPSIIVLSDSTKPDTEAIVFKIEQLLITSQNVTSIAANSIGLFLCAADRINETQLRIIDDFSISFAHDSRGSTESKFLTNIQASVDSLLLRLSLRDIRLALTIFHRANELYQKVNPSVTLSSSDPDPDPGPHPPLESSPSSVIIKGEELNVSIGGLRFVLIGDVYELPVLDMNIKPFDIKAINWSTDLSAETHIETFIKIYNYARSSWEPLMETCAVEIYATRSHDAKAGIMVDVVSRQLTEITLTSRSIGLLSQISSLISDDVKLKSRDDTSPYRILNETGYDIEVWIDEDNSKITSIPNQHQIPWAFEDWRNVRENLDTDNKRGVLAIKLVNSRFDNIRHVSLMGEGETIIMMDPPVDGVHCRLVVDITLGKDNIKTVWLRSTVQVKNDSDVAISVENHHQILVIESGQCKSLAVDQVYNSELRFKPNITVDGVQYDWSNQQLYWKQLLYGGSPLACGSLHDDTAYYFQAEASYDKDEPLARIYPHMQMVISSPLQITNLLPFNLNYRLYDKGTRKDWKGSISKGCTNYIHVASLQSLLLLSVEPLGCGFGKSEFAIINAPDNSEFHRENAMRLHHDDGQHLDIRVHYPRKHPGNSGLKVMIYSPYVILNKTSHNIVVADKSNQLVSHAKATDSVMPKMFSFDKDDKKKRGVLRVGDSQPSVPLSFDAIGQDNAVAVQINGKRSEMNIAVSVAEGQGKYNLTKVITIAPRYIVKNMFTEPLQIVENGSNNILTLEPNQLVPLYGLRCVDKKSLVVKFSRNLKSWSSPFAIDDIGQIFLKVYNDNIGQVLLKVNILTENGTIFVQIESANDRWPFSIQNYTNCEFFIYQSDPNVNENGDIVKTDVNYKPVYYKVPAKSVMPYAYDFPNAIIKELVIRAHGRERAVNLSEIGNLRPFRLPPTPTSEPTIIDLNVVADGPTQSLIISDYDPSVSMYKLQRRPADSSQVFEAMEHDENYHTRIITRFDGFGVSLINARSQELVYATVRGLEVRYNESDLYQTVSVKLKWVQVDNQLYGGIFPIVVYPTVVPRSGQELNTHPAFSGSICKVKDDSHGVLFIKYATVLLQEMTIEIDEDFLFALLDFAKIDGASWNKQIVDKLCEDSLQLPQPQRLSETSDIYFEALHLQPVLTNLSFVRTERVNAEDKAPSQNTLMFFFNVLTMAVGNVNDAPIKLNALFIENIRVPIPILWESIQTHYGQAFFYQLHKLLGSADVIGNPVGLFNNIASGVLDIFYEPYQGFIINDRPQELGIGLAKGGLSFLKKSIFGFSNTIAKVSGSLAKGLSIVTLDEKFQERRRLNQRRNKPKHALYGFASGANSLFASVSSGVTGFATAPIEGANSGGTSGFFRGVGKGLVGLPTKTAIGIFDLASNISEGIQNTTTAFDADGLDKVRLPRYISYDQVIRPFSPREAQGQFWLKSIDGGIYIKESYLAHLVLPGEERALLVTFKKMILFDIGTLKVRWIIELHEIKAISMESTGINIELTTKHGPFIPIPEKASRAFIYGKIGIAVDDYNKTCQVVL